MNNSKQLVFLEQFSEQEVARLVNDYERQEKNTTSVGDKDVFFTTCYGLKISHAEVKNFIENSQISEALMTFYLNYLVSLDERLGNKRKGLAFKLYKLNGEENQASTANAQTAVFEELEVNKKLIHSEYNEREHLYLGVAYYGGTVLPAQPAGATKTPEQKNSVENSTNYNWRLAILQISGSVCYSRTFFESENQIAAYSLQLTKLLEDHHELDLEEFEPLFWKIKAQDKRHESVYQLAFLYDFVNGIDLQRAHNRQDDLGEVKDRLLCLLLQAYEQDQGQLLQTYHYVFTVQAKNLQKSKTIVDNQKTDSVDPQNSKKVQSDDNSTYILIDANFYLEEKRQLLELRNKPPQVLLQVPAQPYKSVAHASTQINTYQPEIDNARQRYRALQEQQSYPIVLRQGREARVSSLHHNPSEPSFLQPTRIFQMKMKRDGQDPDSQTRQNLHNLMPHQRAPPNESFGSLASYSDLGRFRPTAHVAAAVVSSQSMLGERRALPALTTTARTVSIDDIGQGLHLPRLPAQQAHNMQVSSPRAEIILYNPKKVLCTLYGIQINQEEYTAMIKSYQLSANIVNVALQYYTQKYNASLSLVHVTENSEIGSDAPNQDHLDDQRDNVSEPFFIECLDLRICEEYDSQRKEFHKLARERMALAPRNLSGYAIPFFDHTTAYYRFGYLDLSKGTLVQFNFDTPQAARNSHQSNNSGNSNNVNNYGSGQNSPPPNSYLFSPILRSLLELFNDHYDADFQPEARNFIVQDKLQKQDKNRAFALLAFYRRLLFGTQDAEMSAIKQELSRLVQQKGSDGGI